MYCLKHSLRYFYILSATWQKGESKNGGNKKAQHTKFSKKSKYFLPLVFILAPLWDSLFTLLPTISRFMQKKRKYKVLRID